MWATTFQRFPAGKTTILGAINVAVQDWARPQSGESRMFDQDLLERLTCVQPAAPLALYGPGGVALLAWAGWRGASLASLALWYLAGLLIWSLVEYVMHRWSFHHMPTTRTQVVIGYISHGVHHAFPDDSRRWMLPLVVTVPLGALIFAGFRLALGDAGVPGFAGFMHGYLTYDLLHHAIHRGAMTSSFGRFLRRHHLQHHYATPDRRFGVSSPLWDLIFGTVR